jgi:uncharacterized membrane protein YgaE (UPF0421/DUF939 family)
MIWRFKLKKKGILDRFKRLSKPTGSPQWGHAIRTIILMVIAGLMAKLLGLDNGIQAIMFITLMASLIIDISLPIRKVAILGLLGFFMTTLAFLSASLALSSFELFIIFTAIWAFFSISLYIFGTTEGSIGFTFFLIYFVAVLLVNNMSTPLDWTIYVILSYLIVSILFIPKVWLEKKRIREMVSLGFVPSSTILNVFSTRHLLTGIPLNSNNFDILKLGGFLKILRNYSRLLTSRLPPQSNLLFKSFLKTSDEISLKIVDHFKTNKGSLDLKELNSQLSIVESEFEDRKTGGTFIDISSSIRDILSEANEILSRDAGKKNKKIKAPNKSLKDVIKANFNLNNLYIRHAIRFTLAITIALSFVYLTRERSAIWITMGVLIILKPDITSTIDNLISRVGFNLFAIILAIFISFIFPNYLLLWFAFIMLFLFRAFYPNYMGLSVMAITVFVVLIWPTGTVFDNAIARLVDIAIGGIIAFLFAYIILPSRSTVNLPDQLFRTIKANITYANHVLISIPNDSNTKKLSKYFKAYLKEENNLEAAIKKLEDTFNDINEDIELYNEIIASNNKMTADLFAMVAILNTSQESLSEHVNIILNLKTALKTLEDSLQDNTKSSNLSMQHILNYNNDKQNNDLKQVIKWILFDVHLIQKGIEIADEKRLFETYTRLT